MLPLPVARLRRRSRNAKSAKDRHDTAFYALEVSVRIAVAAAPPADVRPLARATFGQWASSLRPHVERSADPALRAVLALCSEIGLEKRAEPATVGARELLDALAAYRNRVIGHGSARDAEFYDDAGATLLAGLDAAWGAGFFLSPDARLVYAESVSLATDGSRRARLFDLRADVPQVLDPLGSVVPEHVLPRRLYLWKGDSWISMHPWHVFEETSERLYCFHAFQRRIEYLDFGSGEFLRGARLEELVPGIAPEIAALFAGSAAAAPTEEKTSDDKRFGDYTILGKLGEGGMGTVYLARQESLQRMVALKMLPEERARDPIALARFRREITALARCEHANVVKILASGEERGIRYYAMEFVDGADLRRVEASLSATNDFRAAVSSARASAHAERSELFADLPEFKQHIALGGTAGDRYRDVARFFRDAARGVHHLHEHGIIHRDLSPANLMATAPGERAVVMDLGLAFLEESSLSLTREKDQILGTLRYMSPEQLQRSLLEVDRRSDVYSLGAVLYELLCDEPLFDGDSEPRLIEQVLREEPVPLEKKNPEIAGDLAMIVHKATDKDPRLRYDTAEAMASDLDAFLDGRAISARAPTPGYLLRRWVARNRALAAASAALMALSVVTFATVSVLFVKQTALEHFVRSYSLDTFRLNRLLAFDDVSLTRPAPLEAWLAETKDILARVPDYVARLRRMGLESGDGKGVQSDYFASLANDLEEKSALAAARCPTAEQLLKRARELPQLLDRPDWLRASRDISDVKANPQYEGLTISPQLALVPLGPDPDSRLWEFSDVLTGDPATRLANGKLKFDARSGLVFVLVPPGVLDKDRVGAYLVSKYEMTQGQWLRVCGANPSAYKIADLHPVENVSWDDCVHCLERLGLRLPTAVEWEYAARAGTNTAWSTGDSPESLRDYANIADQSLLRASNDPTIPDYVSWDDGFPVTAPVGSFLPNGFGLYDVHGNVMEWCFDVADASASNPQRVIRGGAWDGGPSYQTCRWRLGDTPGTKMANLGLRPVRNIDR